MAPVAWAAARAARSRMPSRSTLVAPQKGQIKRGAPSRPSSSVTKRITIKNVGRTPLAITVGNLNPPFHVGDNGGNMVMPPRSYINVTINFRPDSEGSVQQKLQILSSDPRRPVSEVTLFGRGFVP